MKLGFQCRVLAYDVFKNPAAEGLVEYVTLEELCRQSRVISLHW